MVGFAALTATLRFAMRRSLSAGTVRRDMKKIPLRSFA